MKLLLLLASLAFCSVSHATRLDNPTSNRLILTWGQNSVSSQSQSNDFAEKSLYTACSYADIVHIYGVVQFYPSGNVASNGSPLMGMSLANHCSTSYPGFTKPASGSVPLQCIGQITDDIKACQAAGKKIIISIVNSISPPVMNNDADGVAVAEAVWSMFLGGAGSTRPFGNDVILDGVDIWVLDNSLNGYTALANRLRTLMDSDTRKKYLLAGSPRCSFPDPVLGPVVVNSPLATNPGAFDYLNIYARGSPDCTFLNKDLFYTTFNKWSTWSSTSAGNLPLFIALPADDYIFAPGDYVPVTGISDLVTNIKSKATMVSGFSVYDFSIDWQTIPCSNRGSQTYGMLLKASFDSTSALSGCTQGSNSNGILNSNPRQSITNGSSGSSGRGSSISSSASSARSDSFQTSLIQVSLTLLTLLAAGFIF